jgi:hypothetical protein
MRSTVTKGRNGSKPAPAVLVEDDLAPGPGDRLVCIAEAAYLKAETRGFAPGHDVTDWLEAEAEFDRAPGQ